MSKRDERAAPSQRVRVLRLIEYDYADSNSAIADMQRWSLGANATLTIAHWAGQTVIRSATIQPAFKASDSETPLLKAAEAVCEFDWSENDSDAAATIEALKQAIAAAKGEVEP